MGYRILYFYKKKNTFYREKKGVNLSFAERELGEAGDSFLKVFSCGLPEYYSVRAGGRQAGVGKIFPRLWRKAVPKSQAEQEMQNAKEHFEPWTSGQLLRLMQNCCEYVSADAYYLEEHFEREIAESGFGFLPVRQRMCGALIGKLTDKLQGIDSILYLWGQSEGQAGELPLSEKLLRRLHYFFYLGKQTEQYVALKETLWQEYGMPVIEIKKVEDLITCRIRRLLVIDDRQESDTDWMLLPRSCVYLDLWSDAAKRAQMEKCRADIKYLSEYLYLRQNIDIQE